MDDLMLLENPMYGYGHRRSVARRTRKNPIEATMTKYTMGVGLMDIVGAVAGVAASSMIPNLIIATPKDNTQKYLKIALSVAATIGVGMGAKAVAGNSFGKAAMIGGLAGTTIILIQTFTGFKIIGEAQPALPMSRGLGRSYSSEFEDAKNL